MSKRLERYVERALVNACGAISSALESTRNNVMNDQAFGIGQLVGAGALPFGDARAKLIEAAKQAGIDKREAESTVDSGLKGGMKKPRNLSDMTEDAPSPPKAKASKGRKPIKDHARKLYREAAPIDGTLAERYWFEHRRLEGHPPKHLRFHARIWHSGLQDYYPALVAPVVHTDKPGNIEAVHVTYLDPATGGKLAADPAKKMYGICRGGAIWLGGHGTQMLVAEGVEKAFACQAATGIPAVSGLSATLLPQIIWPRGLKQLIICADPNLAGEGAIHKAAKALPGIEVLVCYPPTPGRDWDETPAEQIRAAIEAAQPWKAPNGAAAILRPGDINDDFVLDADGRPVKTEANILRAFACSGIELAYDEFAMEYLITGLEGYGPEFSKAAREELYLLIQREYRFKPNWDDFRMVVDSAARRNRFHPVKQYLDRLVWDGVPRLDEWLIRYAGANDTPFVRAVSRIVLVAAVRRIRQPGCKFDEMLVLESPEGKSKSTALLVLASDAYFSDDAPLNEDARTVIERIRGRWIVECADLSGMTRGEVEDLKAFLSRREDAATLKFDPDTTKHKRSCIFVGTTNRKTFLTSDTGNRRFWPVTIQEFDLEALKRDRDQLWAEAAWLEAQGESIRLDPKLHALARAEQEQRREHEPWRELVENALEEIEGKILCEEVWRIVDRPAGQRTQNDNRKLGGIMRELGFERKKVRHGGGKTKWCYVRGRDPLSIIELSRFGETWTARTRPDGEYYVE